MEGIAKILQREGFGLIRQPRDHNAFYYILHAIKNTNEKPSWWKIRKMKKEIFDFELSNASYFHLFLPQCIGCDGKVPPVKCLDRDFDRSRDEKRSPSPREIFAASEVLQRNICLYRMSVSSVKAIGDFKGFIFTPILRHCYEKEPVCIVMLERNDGFPDFGLIDFLDHEKVLNSCPGVLVNSEHVDCFGLKFSNTFENLFTTPSYGCDENVTDLFERFSLEFYGDNGYYARVRNAVCDFEMNEENVDLFYKYADESINELEEAELDEKEKRLAEHIGDIRSGSKIPGRGELYALSSVFNVDIFIGKNNGNDWDLYMPVSSTYTKCLHSPILLKSQRKNSSHYLSFISHENQCACKQTRPVIGGQIGMIADNIYKNVLRAACCPSQRHAFHGHLDHIPNSRRTCPSREECFLPDNIIKTASTRLSSEGRRIDQINVGHGTLNGALAKELYEQKEDISSDLLQILDREHNNLSEKLQEVCNWIQLPIYIFNMVVSQGDPRPGFHWTRFEPNSLFRSENRKSCRFYITLFHDHSKGSFDRITPISGCNCQLPPPVSLLREQRDRNSAMTLHIEPEKRHRVFDKYFSETPDESLYCTEIRDFPPCPPYSGLHMIQQREDMRERTIDYVEYFDHSLLRCISKEIFGTEQRIDFLLKELTVEILQNLDLYIPFMEGVAKFRYEKKFGKIKDMEKEGQKLLEFCIFQIEDDFPIGDLLLWVVSTFFQTEVLVLRFEESKTSTKTYWTEHFPLRKRTDRDGNLRRKREIITLLESQTKRFYRIVSRDDACNCNLGGPVVPETMTDPASVVSPHDWKFVRQMRKIEANIEIVMDTIDQWQKCNLLLQQTCDKVIEEMELRRRNVNIATISGSGAGILGAVLTAVGIGVAPLTAGASLALAIGGGVLAVGGGSVAAGAKITETVMNTKTVDILKRYQDGYQERFEDVQCNLRLLADEITRLGDFASSIKTNQDIEALEFASVQSLPGILRMAKGIAMIPLAVLRISARGITILGVIIGPLSALVDVGFMAFSIRNMWKGNKTDVTENLRRISASLYGTRRQMHAWAFGNQKILFHD